MPLLVHDLSNLIAPMLHYAGIINLSLASKALRQVVYPIVDLSTRPEAFRIYTCDKGTKFQCGVCKIQTCRVR